MQNIDSDLIRGNIDTIILKTMLNEDKYGLDIIKEVEQRSSGTYELKQPTLYSCLKRLENQELISSYWLNSDIGGRRHYYKLTDKGREFYNKKQEEWAKSKFVIDNLLSNYNYEEYRLVKKDDYDKAMSIAEAAEKTNEFPTLAENPEHSTEFFADNYEDETQEVSNENDISEDTLDESLEPSDNDGLSLEEESQNYDDFEDGNDEIESGYETENNTDDIDIDDSFEPDEYEFSADENDNSLDYEGSHEDSEDNDEFFEEEADYSEDAENENEGEDDSENEMVYVSQKTSSQESEDTDEDDNSPSYDLPDQTQNESNILDMLRRQQKEEINTYEGDKKSYASQIRSIYDDVKYVQDDMIIATDDESDEVDQKIKEFTEAANKLEEFENATQDNTDEDVEENFENEEPENGYDFENISADLQEYNHNDDDNSYDDLELGEDDSQDYNFDKDDELSSEDNTAIDSDEIVNAELDEFDFSASDDEAYAEEETLSETENFDDTFANTSFFSNSDNFDYQPNTQVVHDFDDSNKETFDSFETPANNYSYDNDFKPSQFESYHSSRFDKEQYDSTFVNVKKDTESSLLDEKSLENSDIDSIISKNVSSKTENIESSNNFFERRYVGENYKQKLSNLTVYSKATSEKTEQTAQNDENSQVDDIETLKINFEREGIKVREYKKSNTYEQPEKTYLLANKINLIKSLILLFGYAFVLSGMYIILQNSSFGLMTEGFSIKYFLFGLIPFAILALYHLIIYLISPYKKVPARFASRIMIFLAVIVTVQLLLITYCVNLQLGFYSFTQAGYNHLLWVIPTVISFGPIISNLIYMALFYSGNFNV